jgi:hypothetical protein
MPLKDSLGQSGGGVKYFLTELMTPVHFVRTGVVVTVPPSGLYLL